MSQEFVSTREVKLRSGGLVGIGVHANFLEISKGDMDFLSELRGLVERYESGELPAGDGLNGQHGLNGRAATLAKAGKKAGRTRKAKSEAGPKPSVNHAGPGNRDQWLTPESRRDMALLYHQGKKEEALSSTWKTRGGYRSITEKDLSNAAAKFPREEFTEEELQGGVPAVVSTEQQPKAAVLQAEEPGPPMAEGAFLSKAGHELKQKAIETIRRRIERGSDLAELDLYECTNGEMDYPSKDTIDRLKADFVEAER